MKQKIAKKGETKAEICVKMHISFVYKGLECVYLQKRNRKQMYDQIKENTTVGEKKINCSFF